MTGLSKEEPLYANPETVADLLGQAKPGDVLRNLLAQVSRSEKAWSELSTSIERLFGYRLLPPDASGAYIIAEYQASEGGPRLDISSAGSGFQQVLMLLTFLNTRPATVLLLDEPDAHLHVLLQDSIYGELRAVAAREQSQLIMATHSEVIINSVDPRELWVTLQTVRPLAEDEGGNG
jgi:predicted ATPase